MFIQDCSIDKEGFKIFGYARVSSSEQNLIRQVKDLEAYGCKEIVIEKKLVLWNDQSLGRIYTIKRELFD